MWRFFEVALEKQLAINQQSRSEKLSAKEASP